MENPFLRTEMLVGKKSMEKLYGSKVAVFGIGGVGSFATEALARAGIGKFSLFDSDKVDVTNINRQIIADFTTIGQNKTDIMKKRILKINPSARVDSNVCFFDYSNEKEYDFDSYDYIVDCVDSVGSKILIAEKAKKSGKKIISSMGTGNKTVPLKFEVSDIYKTSVCPLARVMRKELKTRNISSLKVVYSKEIPVYKPTDGINASISFVPSVAGLIIASEVVKDLINI